MDVTSVFVSEGICMALIGGFASSLVMVMFTVFFAFLYELLTSLVHRFIYPGKKED